MVLCELKGKSTKIVLTKNDLYISGDYLNLKNGYLKKASGSVTIKIEDILSISLMKMRSKYIRMIFLYLGGFALLFYTIFINSSKTDLIRYLFSSNLNTLKLIYFFILVIAFMILILYLTYSFKKYKLLDISYLGGRVAIRTDGFEAADLHKLIDNYYVLK